MVLQLEECADVLKDLHTSIDFIFLFYHSCGNDIGREYGLNVMKINNRYGEAKLKMNPNKSCRNLVILARMS